ncbi:MAG: hypothetical protein JF887_14060 [Candidatus Dormibacteraeota bacterium]|uniref:Glycosyl hydrolase n=1 Tax=Candidatus Amunia macphersoniae TaxID=3127014 RepID=A0A934KP56_9BACT|nr:hypothetical protein [Candidatus Dormibacteraeota bacterium]
MNGRNMSLRRVVVAAVMASALLGTAAASSQLTGQTAQTPTTAATVARAGACDKGTTAISAGLPNAPAVCEPLGQPETFADLQSRANSFRSRDTAPFGTVKAGAYQAALAQRAQLAPAGTLAGSGGNWGPYATAPECAAPSSAPGGPCPMASSANGNYSNVGQLGFRALSGRISSFAYDPGNGGRFFASPVAGGLFESSDGAHWASIGDGLPTQVVGAIAYDVPLRRLLVGSGDNSFGGDGISGHGFFTSSNDGATWTTAAGFPDLALSFRVVVSPADAAGATVYVASSKGLYKSTDGGASFVNENLPTTPTGYSPNCAGNTTNSLCFFASIVTDVVVKGGSSVNAAAGSVMAVVGWRAGQKVDKNPDGSTNMRCRLNGAATACLQAPGDGLYISTKNGEPNSFIYQDQSARSTGFAANNVVGRTALGIAHGAGQDNDAVYAIVEDATKFNGCPDVLDTGINPAPTCNGTAVGLGLATYLDGMYATYNFGTTWTKVMDYSQTKFLNTNSALVGQAGYSPGIQSWYNLWIEPDPSFSDKNGDPQRVAFGLEEIWQNNQYYTPPAGVPAALNVPNPILHDPYTAHLTPGPGIDPWVVIGRYWNACAALNTGVPCNPSTQSVFPGTTTHPDQHAAMFIPDGKGGVTLFAGSDGGVFSQHVAKGGDFNNNNWGDGNNLGLYTQQPYDAEMAVDGTVVAGLQDNGEDKITSAGKQAEIYGGDGFFTTIDPNHSNNIIEEYTYGVANLSNDGGSTWTALTLNSCGGPTSALFSTPIEQDPTKAGHVVIGCTQLQESTDAYGTATFTTAFDLNSQPGRPSTINNVPSALGVMGSHIYAGFCGYCDVVTGGLPFRSGIATNVGGSWHFASANCTGCGAAGKLPQRYINSVQMDPSDSTGNTVYVTMGGYGRRWIPPGALGDDTSLVGNGHVFKSTDGGANFTDISGNLPDTPANWTLIHNGQLVVATDLGVFESADSNGGQFGVLGSGLPTTPVFTLRLSPNPTTPDLMIAATFGRGVYKYTFAQPSPSVPEVLLAPLLPLAGVSMVALVLWRRRRDHRGLSPASR